MSPTSDTSMRSSTSEISMCLGNFTNSAFTLHHSSLGNLQNILNILLFVPFCFFLSMFIRHHYLPVVVGSSLSFLIEMYQAAIGSRTCAGSDWFQNTIGSIIGCLIATAIIFAVRKYGLLADREHENLLFNDAKSE
jgi:glycopeptide antibiotics resistance protein